MLPLDAEETAVFKAFVRNWAEHADHAQAVISLLQTGQVDAATTLLEGAATSTHRAARDELRRLSYLTGARWAAGL
jgi:two-component system, OmpR family, sensor kinase